MGIRARLNDSPKLAFGVTGAFFIIAIVAFVLHGRSTASTSGKAFFSTDDGATWFVGSVDNIPPFEQDGKVAVRAYVVRSGGKEFVGHLERFTSERQKLMQQTVSNLKDGKGTPPTAASKHVPGSSGVEVKKPGDKSWVDLDNYKLSGKIINTPSIAGQTVEEVQP